MLKLLKNSSVAIVLTSIQLSGFALLTNQEIFEGNLTGQGGMNASGPNMPATVSQNQPTWRCVAKSALGGPQFQVTYQGTQQLVSQQAISQCQQDSSNHNTYENPSCTATCTLVSGSGTYQPTAYKPSTYQSNTYQAPTYNPNGAVEKPVSTTNSWANGNTSGTQSSQSTPPPKPNPYQPIVAQSASSPSVTAPASPSNQNNNNASSSNAPTYSNPYQQVMQSKNQTNNNGGY